MKHVLLAASLAAWTAGFCPAWGQAPESRRQAPVPAFGQNPPERQGDPKLSSPPFARPSVEAPETTGRAPSREHTSTLSTYEELKSAAEARRVRDAVSRTLSRTHELSRAASE